MALTRKGKCLNCGNCCRAFVHRLTIDPQGLEEAEDYIKYLSYRKDIKIHRINRFVVEVEFLHPCEFLVMEGEKSSCKIYKTRPQICKRFPESPAKLCKGFIFVEESDVHPSEKV